MTCYPVPRRGWWGVRSPESRSCRQWFDCHNLQKKTLSVTCTVWSSLLPGAQQGSYTAANPAIVHVNPSLAWKSTFGFISSVCDQSSRLMAQYSTGVHLVPASVLLCSKSTLLSASCSTVHRGLVCRGQAVGVQERLLFLLFVFNQVMVHQATSQRASFFSSLFSECFHAHKISFFMGNVLRKMFDNDGWRSVEQKDFWLEKGAF